MPCEHQSLQKTSSAFFACVSLMSPLCTCYVSTCRELRCNVALPLVHTCNGASPPAATSLPPYPHQMPTHMCSRPPLQITPHDLDGTSETITDNMFRGYIPADLAQTINTATKILIEGRQTGRLADEGGDEDETDGSSGRERIIVDFGSRGSSFTVVGPVWKDAWYSTLREYDGDNISTRIRKEDCL
jgi:hypothetical protein